jgi:hypothetical protein
MITRGLHDSGLCLLGEGADELVPAADDNPEGFWENKAIVACNDDLLEATGGAWDNPPDLPPQAVDDPRVRHLADAATQALDGLRAHERWGFKDPRTCLTAAYWLDLEPQLRFIVCVRHPIEVALSLKRRNQISYSLGLALWERYYATVLDLVPAEHRIVTHYDRLFTDPDGELARLCAFAGLEPAELFVRADLRHHDVDVALGDAGVSRSLRDLYAALCAEAGTPLRPDPPIDEGRVRRLVLDGAVAQRHADQRQAAIDRLHEREAEMRARISELERRLAVAHGGPWRAIRRVVRGSVRRGRARVVEPGRRAARRASREAGRAKRTAVSRARSEVSRLPAPAKDTLRRAARVRPPAVVRRAKAAARRLPPPAQDLLRRGYRRGRRLVGRTDGGRARSADPVRRQVAASREVPPRKWFKGYEALVASVVPPGAPWLVVAPGSPARARRVMTPAGTAFPDAEDVRKPKCDLSHIAVLEARRVEGYGHLVVPEGSRAWFDERAELQDHVVRTYRTIRDDPGVGAVFDLAARPEVATSSLRWEVARVAGALGEEPAVLDWTEAGVSAELHGTTTFRPPPGDRLPYADESVPVVVVEAGRDRGDAVRVASRCVITVATGDPSGLRVLDVDIRHDLRSPESPRCLVVSAEPGNDERWRALLLERVVDAGAELRLAPLHAAGVGELGDHDVVVLLEPFVLPLPASIEVAAAAAVADRSAAVAGKLLRADGRLDAAGGTVFSDRSVALVANGTADVSAPWHDYVRAVCWAPGLLAAATSLWRDAPPPAGVAGRDLFREWCAELWARGCSVTYQPAVTAVRVAGDGDGGEPTVPLQSSAWQRVLDLRPRRPRDLGDGTWRHLLAHEHVEACRA